MKTLTHHAVLTGILIAMSSQLGCSPPSSGGSDKDMGSVGMALQIAPGISINTVNWTIANATSGFTRSGSVNEQFANTIRFRVGGIPSGVDYTITLTATSTDGVFSCAGSATFSVTGGATTAVTLNLLCTASATAAGTVIVSGTTQICAGIGSISVSPLETTVNNPIALSATASAGSLTPGFAWTATAGTFDNAASASPIFTCPATSGDVTITLTVSPSAPACSTTSSQSVVVTCDTLTPTFTNVYANVIGVRCTGCHRPGSSGVNVGRLDLSTPAAAYANIVGIPVAGTGAGTSGVTCASLAPGLLRVVPSSSATSLFFDKINSKLAGVNPACGSPMPLPSTGAPLTAAQVDLVGRWIDNGALND